MNEIKVNQAVGVFRPRDVRLEDRWLDTMTMLVAAIWNHPDHCRCDDIDTIIDKAEVGTEAILNAFAKRFPF